MSHVLPNISRGQFLSPFSRPKNSTCTRVYTVTRNYEFEYGLPLTVVEGRLARCQNFWFTKLNCPLFVKCVLRYGYTLPLKAFPATALFSNNRSALKNSDFVQDAIEKLLRN